MRSGIYRIRDTQTGRSYIGSAVNLASRRATHWALLRAGKHRNRKLQNAWRARGDSVFVFEALLLCAPRNLVDYEQRCIDGFGTARFGYNILPRAGSALGFKHSPEHIQALRGNRHRAGIPHTAETRARLAAASLGNSYALGHKHAPEFGAAMSARMRGVPKSEAHRAAIGAAHRGLKRSDEARANMRAAWKRRKARA